MLSKRIIPCLDVTAGRVVKGVSFVNLRDAGDPVELASFYDAEGADELVFLDITASSDNRDTIIEVVQSVSEKIFIPLTVGGGIRSSSDVRKLLRAGADKVAINTAAVLNPQVLYEGSQNFGNQCIVIAIDAREIKSENESKVRFQPMTNPVSHGQISLDDDSRWEVYIHGGRTPTGIDAVKWAAYATELGAGEVLLTSMDADGHQAGFDLALTKTIAETVSVPVIASGGAGKLNDFYDVAVTGKADAVLAASVFHYGTISINEVKNYLNQRSIHVRSTSN